MLELKMFDVPSKIMLSNDVEIHKDGRREILN